MTATPARPAATGQKAAELDGAIVLASYGPTDHGITRLSVQIADAARDLGFGGAILRESEPTRLGDLVDRLPPSTRLLHLHVNDWLFADGRTSADQRIAAVAGRLRRRGIALTVTLHDLPQVSDGGTLFRRRTTTYRAIIAQSDGVVVSSGHERSLLA